MISLFFGLPGAGKTTIMAFLASRHCRAKGKKRKYKHVYGNVRMAIDGYTYIDNSCIGKYDLSDCLLLIDEATLFADSRAYKEFDKDKLSYFLQHRHYGCDIYLFTQQWDGVDRKIRVITDRVYYVYKGFLLGKWWTAFYRIPYGIIIPDKKNGGEKLGEIIQGYCKPSFLVRLLAKKIFRPFYYKYFDSFERPPLPELPPAYKPYIKAKGKVIKTVEAPNEPLKVVNQASDQAHEAGSGAAVMQETSKAQPSTVSGAGFKVNI